MVLDQSALLDLSGELKFTDLTELVRVGVETLHQELSGAEVTAHIGAARSSGPISAALIAPVRETG